MNGGYVALGYNDLGQLVSKTANGVTTRYLVDDLSPTGYSQVAEEAVNGAITRRYTYGLERISQDQVIESVWTPSFYQYDGRGTVRMLTNAAGAVTDAYEYDAFGNLLDHTGTTPNNYLYRGEQWDPDLSLYYLSARYYNPATGRFMSQDPYGGDIRDPASLHRYRYASGNPVNRIDPSGRDDTTEIALGVSWTAIQGYAAIYALGKSINCIYESEASAVRVLNGPQTGAAFEQLLSLRLDEGTCAASAVFSGFALGGMAYGGLQSLLADTEPVAFGANPWRRLLLEEEGSLKPYGEGGGHHVPAKAGFRNAPNYDPDTALAIPDAELNALGLNHPVITGQQQVLYRAFAQTGQPLTWGAVQSIETQALVNAGASPQWAAETVAEAIQDLIANGVSGPTRIPWGG